MIMRTIMTMAITRYTWIKWTCCLCITVGQEVHTLPEGASVRGVTLLGDKFYVLRQQGTMLGWKAYDQIEVYDVINYHFQGHLTVPNSWELTDIASCEHYCCVYIVDIDKCIHRLDVKAQLGAATQWAVNDKPWGISVNAAHHVLVTCLLYTSPSPRD